MLIFRRALLFYFILLFSISSFAENIKKFDRLIVNGTRLDQTDIENLPLNISIISSEEIKLNPSKTIPELLSIESGIQKRSEFGNNAVRSSIDIRGFGITGTQNTLILLDGKRLNDNDQSSINYSSIPIKNIERIEIIKGSGGVLYGDGAVGGAINIVTKTPSYKTKNITIEQTLGSYDSLETDVYAEYNNEDISANIFGNLIHSDGYRVNNKLEQQSLSANISYFFQKTELFLKLGVNDQNLRLPGDRSVNFTTGVDDFSYDRKGSDDPFDFAIENGTFFTAGFIQSINNNTELLVDMGYKTKETDLFLKANQEFRTTNHSNLYFSPKLKWKFKLFEKQHKIDLGFDIYHYQFNLDIENRTSAETDHEIAQAQHRIDIEQENYSFYLNDFFELSDKTFFQIGGRLQHTDVDAFDQFDSNATLNFGSNSNQRAALNKSDRGYMANLGLKHNFNSHFSGHVTAGQSIRFANNDDFNQLAEVTFAKSFSNIKPQRGRYVDSGINYTGNYISSSVGLYFMKIRNQIDFDPARSVNRNFQPIERKGVEYSLKFKPYKNMYSHFNYAYTSSTFDEGANKGNRVPLVSEHTGSWLINYKIFDGMNFSVLWNYVGNKIFDNDQDNTFFAKIPSHSTVDIKLIYERKNLDFGFSLNNMLNKEYFETGTTNSLLFDAEHTRFNAQPMPERNFSFRMRYKFN